ncbi:MAG: hypothetical protein VW338_09470 [Rhodospirillaceae bacterium]
MFGIGTETGGDLGVELGVLLEPVFALLTLVFELGIAEPEG